jgi:hypothetical protein
VNNTGKHRAVGEHVSFLSRRETPVIILVAATLLCVLFALGVIGPPLSQVNDQKDSLNNSYTGQQNPINAEFVGPTQIVFTNSEVYQGGLQKSRFSGQGKFLGSTAQQDTEDIAWTLEGNFVSGRLMGEGTYSDPKGNYKGNFENSLAQGHGIYHSNAGWSYEGNFIMGAMTGYGIVHSPTGEIFEGEWRGGVLVDQNMPPTPSA